MKKIGKTLLSAVLVAVLIGGAVAGFAVHRHAGRTIGREAALSAALTAAGLSHEQVYDVEVEYESGHRAAWYEVSFDCADGEYDYDIDARSGEVLSWKLDR